MVLFLFTNMNFWVSAFLNLVVDFVKNFVFSLFRILRFCVGR